MKLPVAFCACLGDVPDSQIMRRCDGFTLLEICLAIVIGLLLLGLAIPSITSLLDQQKLSKTFEDFDQLVREAQRRSVSERRSYVLRWDEEGVTVEPFEPATDEDPESEVSRFALDSGAEMTLERPAALEKEALKEWVFWRSGTCEPVMVGYASAVGTWLARYDPLTARANSVEQSLR